MEIIITTNGQGRCVYAEDIDLTALGQLSIRRGSHVEATADACWLADMSPVEGPVLGPFRHRSAAVGAELRWLRAHWLHGRGSLVVAGTGPGRRQARRGSG